MLRTYYVSSTFYLFTDAKFSVWYRWTDGNVDWSISVNSCGVIRVNCNSAYYNVQNIQEKRSSGRCKAKWKLFTKALKYALKRRELQFYNNCRNFALSDSSSISGQIQEFKFLRCCIIVKEKNTAITTLPMLWRTSWSKTRQTDEKRTSIS